MKGLMKLSLVRWLMLAATLFPVATVHGQCNPLPLPYTTDLLTGFQPPSDHPTGFEYPWREGLYSDNCWTGYLDFGGDPPYYPLDANSARGRFGYNVYVDGVPWPQYAEIAVKDSTHHGMAMLIAPEFVTAPAAIRVHGRLERYFNSAAPYPPGGEEERYWGRLEMGWVTDMAHPNESFLHTGTFAIRSFPLLDTSLYHWCIPLHGNPPAGSHFALRMRSKAQGPAQNYVSTNYFYYEFEIWRITMDTATCPPPQSTDTVYITDSICQHSLYQRNGIALAASETADTGTRIFVIHEYEFFSSDSCLCHVKVLTLRVLPSELTFVRDSIFPGEAYTFFGRELTLAGNYGVDRGLNAYGCPIKDSLELSIMQLPPLGCGADIGVEQTEWYISQPVTVHLWAEQEEGSYRWSPPELFAGDTSRDVYFQLSPDSQQRVGLTVERLDTINHIYRGAEMDTVTDTLRLQVPVEPQTRYLLEMTLGEGTDVPVQVFVQTTQLFDSIAPLGRLSVEFFTYQNHERTLTIVAPQAVRMRDAGLYRYCCASDSVLIVSHSARPIIYADKNIICEGDTLHLTAEQTDCYAWSSQPHDTALDAQQGQRRVVVSPRETTTYYLLGSTGSVADSLTVTVERLPQLRIVAEPEVIDFDNPVLTLEERAEDIVVSTWAFSDGFEATGHKVRHELNVGLTDSVWVTATGCTQRGCCSDTSLVFPVEVLAVWFPNVFTPNAETNNRFGMVASKEVVEYSLYIYNRNGLLVWSVDSYGKGWDGHDLRGGVCPQGAYAYTCDYRLANGVTKRQMGTVLLLR